MRYCIIISALIISCSSPTLPLLPVYDISIEEQYSGSTASLRGLSVVDSTSAWASGSGGAVLRTIDGGKSWQNVSSNLPDTLDFRDIEAFSSNKAVIITAGYPGLIYKTINGGKRWHLVHKDDRKEIFYDAMGFWSEKSGIAFGDAIDGKVVILSTNDYSVSWQNRSSDESPDAINGEGGFAASGTCLITLGDSEVWIALGTPNSRILYSPNRGKTWNSYDTPMAQDTEGAGIFSLAFSTSTYGLAVGGNYTKPDDKTNVLSYTENGGRSWQLINDSGIGGYKSAVTHLPESQNWISTGPSGVYYSSNNGKGWQQVDSTGYHAVQVKGQIGWLSGGNGRIAKISFTKNN